MHSRLAREIHHREQQVADLVLQPVVRLVVLRCFVARFVAEVLQLDLHLLELLVHFLDWPLGGRPVEANACGAILQPDRAMQRRKPGRQPFHDGLALPGLHLLPGLPRAVAVQVRMPRAHLGEEAVGDVGQRERAALFRDHRVKQDLEEQVPELFAQTYVVTRLERVVDLVGFLDQVGAQRLMVLRRIPLAALSQVAHQRQRIFKRRFHLLGLQCILRGSQNLNAMQRLMTRAWVEIDLGALVRNGERFARAAGVPLLPMVKADGYGLGAVRVAHALLALNPWGFGVATPEEGEELRRSGIEKPILVFSPVLPQQFDTLRRARLRPVLADRFAIEQWADTEDPWHLAIDTGMNRAGVAWREMATLLDLIDAHPPEGACTHFHSSQLPNGSRGEQERRFAEAIAQLPSRPKLLHADNSAAVEQRSSSPFSFVRPGVFLYGVGSGHNATIQPDPVVSVRGRIVEVRVVQEGDTVGYDAAWTATRGGRIATVSLGYADGYRRGLGNRAQALVKGERVPVVGHVTMDMTMIDVTDKRCVPGDVVTLIGRDGDVELTVGDVAAFGNFSPYEILTGLRGRLPRVYTDAEP